MCRRQRPDDGVKRASLIRVRGAWGQSTRTALRSSNAARHSNRIVGDHSSVIKVLIRVRVSVDTTTFCRKTLILQHAPPWWRAASSRQERGWR